MKLAACALALCLVLVFAANNRGNAAPSSSSLQQQVVAKEREELDCLKTGDMKKFASLIADDAVFLDPHGPGAKAEVVENSAQFKIIEYSMEDIHFVPLSAKSGLIAYKLTQKASSHGHDFTNKVFASAIWAERDGKWVTLFSQETPAK